MPSADITCVVCSRTERVAYIKTIPKTCSSHRSPFGTRVCKCGTRFVKGYGSAVKCENCKVRRGPKPEDDYIRTCFTCGDKFECKGHGLGRQKYCTIEHNPSDMTAEEIRALYKQFPNGLVWQVPTYRKKVEHLIVKRPRQ